MFTDSEHEHVLMSSVAQQSVPIALEADQSSFRSYPSSVLNASCSEQVFYVDSADWIRISGSVRGRGGSTQAPVFTLFSFSTFLSVVTVLVSALDHSTNGSALAQGLEKVIVKCESDVNNTHRHAHTTHNTQHTQNVPSSFSQSSVLSLVGHSLVDRKVKSVENFENRSGEEFHVKSLLSSL